MESAQLIRMVVTIFSIVKIIRLLTVEQLDINIDTCSCRSVMADEPSTTPASISLSSTSSSFESSSETSTETPSFTTTQSSTTDLSTTTAPPTTTTQPSTTVSSTTLSTTTPPASTSLTCPPGCPFVDDPNDDCARYYICDPVNGLIPNKCPGVTCFDQEKCQCNLQEKFYFPYIIRALQVMKSF
ncbi:hypothetical protein Anas_08420 [Armadillidium nasatum]|uniref:Chitin-binding type-2 domain-containing protein n=1 Tax=Armadillidium nasatum TaxID=96803 RepID=A0A5N5SLP6_9CRUS|nr:hypothetical protein Anas_08420 [Armadillidium nasatum]